MKTPGNSLCGLVLGLFIISVFMSCQAGQPKTAKTPPAKQAPVAASETAPAKPAAAKAEAGAQNKLVVYYFHSNARCPTCFKLESYAKSEVESDFAGAIKKGKLEWKTINVEEKGNEHFGDDYNLYTKSVIVSIVKDGKQESWKNLDQIWQLVHEEDKYREYIKNEVKACLEGKCL